MGSLDLPARPRAVLFDWDNTLVDNWGTITEALNAALVAFGHPPNTVEQTRRSARLSLRESFPLVFGERWTEARDIYYAHFAARHLDTLQPMPGAARLLTGLAARGTYLAVVSNKQGDWLRREAASLQWQTHFGRLVGAGDAARDKPAAEPALLALAGSGIEIGADVWLVGDSPVDLACARAAGCAAILVHGGDVTAAERAATPPDLELADLRALAALVC